jgi:stalled ribosome rescue protein Dom34
MEAKKSIGIWMDHSVAKFIEGNAGNNSSSILSDFTASVKEEALSKNENLMHNKEQQMQEAYYKEIAKKILEYEHVLLFGPTNAKAELHNYLNKDLKFRDIKIDVESADKMTDNEMNAFVKDYFKQ